MTTESHTLGAPANFASLKGESLRASLASNRTYLIFIFSTLAVWFLGVQILYGIIDGPGVSTQNRAEGFAFKMVFGAAIFMLFLMVVRLLQFTRKIGDASLISAFKEAYQRDPARPLKWVIYAALAILSYVALMTNFMAVKTAIPEITPFYLDEPLRRMDQAIFLGRDPWTYFGWMYEYPRLIAIIDRTYTTWAALIAGIWLYCFTSRAMPKDRRFQYIIGMILLWFVGGNVFATILSSAGPCYYEYFTGSEAYRPLLAKLATINETHPLGAYKYHDVLLSMYESKETRFAGISAAPSLHCATSLMMLLLFWKNKIARFLLIAFNLAIYVGSIVLAWHYAVDGLFAIPLTIGCWYGAGYIVKKLNPSPAKT